LTRRASPRLWLVDILESIERIRSYVVGHDVDSFLATPVVIDAVTRNLEIISEAARHLPAELTQLHPALPWRQIADLGNKLRHEYFRTDPRIVWGIVVRDLVPLANAVRSMIEPDSERS
jgi:uncharacterized protein with HEPN domain